MNTPNTHHNASGNGVPATTATSHQDQRAASGSALPSRQPSTAASPPLQAQSQNQNRTPLPQHFIVRPGVTKLTASGTVTTPGPIVPLIAVDQLPEWLDLFGVPRELSLEQTVGLSNLGTVVRNPEFYTVYMHGDFQSAPVVTGGSRSQDIRREGQRREDKNSALLIPSDVSTSGPPSSSSSAVSTPTSPLSSRMDPVAKAIPNISSATTSATTTKNTTNTSSQPPAAMTPNLYQRIPSPTAVGSTPPAPNTPYPILHPSYAPLPPPPYPSAHAPAPYPIPPHPPPSSLHPAERMLYSWNLPSVNARKSNNSSSARPKSSTASTTAGATNPNSNNTSNNTNTNSVYCKHWCHRGTCRWGAQCRYAHAMPATPEGLREVGLSHHPAWWTTAFNMAYGAGGFGAWYGPSYGAPLPGKHYGGGGKKAQKGKEKEKEKEEKGKAVEGDGGSKEGVGGGGGEGESSGRLEVGQAKKDAVEGKAGGNGGPEKRKPEPPKEEPKLVEI